MPGVCAARPSTWVNLLKFEVPVVMVFGGCMGAIVAMEIVLKGDPKQLSCTEMPELQGLATRIQHS